MSHLITQRTREIGIRIALGARASDVLLDISADVLLMVLPGAAIGLAGSVALTRLIKSVLFEVSPLDPVALAFACLTVAAVGLMAGLLPARRAVQVDPAVTLRDIG